jgi:hypothetical protein
MAPVSFAPFFCSYMLHVYIAPINALLMPCCQYSIIYVVFRLLFYSYTTIIKAPWVIFSTTCHGHHYHHFCPLSSF